MGKTAVFVLSTLQLLQATDGHVSTLVLCNTRELAFQIEKEFQRFAKHLPGVKCAVFFGGLPVNTDIKTLEETKPVRWALPLLLLLLLLSPWGDHAAGTCAPPLKTFSFFSSSFSLTARCVP